MTVKLVSPNLDQLPQTISTYGDRKRASVKWLIAFGMPTESWRLDVINHHLLALHQFPLTSRSYVLEIKMT